MPFAKHKTPYDVKSTLDSDGNRTPDAFGSI